MNNVITVTFDGQVLKPINALNLEINKQYKIQLISDFSDLSLRDENNKNQEKSNSLDELHQEFNWLVADLGVNEPLTRDKGYDK